MDHSIIRGALAVGLAALALAQTEPLFVIRTVAGTGWFGSTGNGGPATLAQD